MKTLYCTCYSTIWPLPGSPQRTWSLNAQQQNWLRRPWKLPPFILLMCDSISDLEVTMERDAEQPSWGLLWVRHWRCITATPQLLLNQPLASCVRTEKALAKRHEFWRRKCITDTSIAPVLLLNLQLQQTIFFSDSSPFQKSCWVNPSSSFCVQYWLPVFGIVPVTSFCRLTFALCQSLMHQTPAFLWNEASRTCGVRWLGVKHGIESQHLGWSRIMLSACSVLMPFCMYLSI